MELLGRATGSSGDAGVARIPPVSEGQKPDPVSKKGPP
jgi:hypothetical protein